MTTWYTIRGKLTSPGALPRLLESAVESRKVQQKLGAPAFRIYTVCAGGMMSGSFTFSAPFASNREALQFQDSWDNDAAAQKFMTNYMVLNPPMTVESIDLLEDIDIGTAADTSAPTAGLAVQVVPQRGQTEQLVTLMADAAPFVRKLGALSVRLMAFGIGGEQSGGFVEWIEARSLADIGQISDAFNDQHNAQAMKARMAFEDRDGPIASYAAVVVKEIAY